MSVLDAANLRKPELDPLEHAMTFPAEGPTPAGPAPASRKRADAVPDHLWSDDAVRCRSAGYGPGKHNGGGGGGSGGNLARLRYRGGAYGDLAYARGGGSGAGGGGWGMGFRRSGGGGNGDAAGGGHGVVPDDPGGFVPVSGVGARGRAHDGRVTALSCTPDGLYLVSAGTDHRLRLWDLATGRNCNAAFGPVGRGAREYSYE